MKVGKKGLDIIKAFEGFQKKAYLCPANVWTIGYGTTKGVKKGQITTEEEATLFLMRDAKEAEDIIKKLVKVPLNQSQFDALVSFIYNVGVGNFAASTLLRELNSGRYDKVPEQLNRWNKAGGKVLKGLTKRRLAEGKLFSSKK